ncbi:MAG TPA: hypothetical protein VGR27_04005, partial [Longimicrobiaceae bacterium]|nr:hypothetical protein [Longimicrobiaceae bacterium]
FGDGFATVVDPSDPRFGYAMSQGGMLMRFDLVTGERRSIRPWAPDTVDLRFNWNAGIAIDPFDPRTIYYGSQFVHMSPDRGDTWRILSPDLTTNRKEWQEQAKSGGLTLDVTAAENFTTILTIAPSAVERGVIWVGTDDGNVQLTRDGGQTWTNVVRNIRGVPANSWVPHVEPSKFDAGTAFAVFDNHRRGDFKPYVYRTTDYGRSWTSIATPAIQGFAHVIEQDPIEPNLLFLGTEQGMWVSLNGGRSWRKWTAGLPTVPVTGLIVHPRDHDLVIGTHGRAVYILDDLGPLRALARNPELQRQALHMFDIPTTIQYTVKQVDGYRFPADAMFRGENRPYGALITYVVTPSATPASPAARAAGARADTAAAGQDPQRAKIEVLDATGKVIRDFNGPAEAGIHRVAWNLRTNGFKRPPSDEEENEPEEFRPQGPAVLPGSYTVRIKANGQEATQRVEIVSDPREEYTLEARRVKFERLMMVGRQQELAVEALERLRQTDKAIDLVLQMTRDDTTKRELRQSADSLKQKVQELWEVFTGPRNLQGIVRSSDAVLAKLGFAYGALASSSDAPTEAQMTYHRQGEEALREALPRVNRFLTEDVERFRQQVQAAGFSIFPETTPIRAEAAMR